MVKYLQETTVADYTTPKFLDESQKGAYNKYSEKRKKRACNRMEQKKMVLRGEAALIIAVIINSLGVLLMLQSGSGISAISSVPYAFHQVFPKLTLGTWISGLISSFFDDYEKEICAFLLIQLCGRICIWRNDGCA